jgi:hypothetical protein
VPPNSSLTEWELRYAVHCRRADGPPIPVLLRTPALSASIGFPADEEDQASLSALLSWIADCPAIAPFTYDSFEAFESIAETALAQLLSGHQHAPRSGSRASAPPVIDRTNAIAMLDAQCRWGRPALALSVPGAGASWIARRWLERQSGSNWYFDGRTTSLDEIGSALCAAAMLRPSGRAAPSTDPIGDGTAASALIAALDRLAATGRRVTIVLDNYEEAVASTAGADLSWLPARIARNIRVLIVTHSQRLFAQARGNRLRVMEIASPARSAVGRYAIEYLGRYSKQLEPQDAVRIADAAWGANLHVASVALEELRRHGSFETLHEQVQRVTQADSASALADIVLEGVAATLPPAWRSCARDMLLVLALSLRGLARDEIETVLARIQAPEGAAVPSHIFGAIRLALAPFLAPHDGLFDLHQSALGDWLDQPAQRARLAELANIFDASLRDFAPERARIERPSLAWQAGGEARLAALLADPDAARSILAAGPTYFEGWLALLRPDSQSRVFESWLGSDQLASLAEPERIALAEFAARFGDPERAAALLREGGTLATPLAATVRLQAALITRDREPFEQALSQWLAGGTSQGPAILLLAGAAAGAFDPSVRQTDAILKEARGDAGREGMPLPLAQFHLYAGQLMIARARWRASLGHFASAEALARRIGASALLCRALERRSALLIETRRFSAARQAADECRELAASMRLLRYEALAFERLIEIEKRRANWTQAYSLAATYLDRARSEGGDVSRAEAAIDALEARS